MKKRFKGFTLVECLVALGVLGIASLTMAQIYASVSIRNKMNHLVNTSLTNQMSYVEKATNTEAVEVKYGNTNTSPAPTPPHKTSKSQNDFYLKVVKNVTGTAATADEYSYPVDVYILKSRDRNNSQLTSDGGYTEADYNLRYKYFLGHSGS